MTIIILCMALLAAIWGFKWVATVLVVLTLISWVVKVTEENYDDHDDNDFSGGDRVCY